MGILRLLLAFSVIASHSDGILGSTMLPGGMAVQVFFMISGFYMALVLDGRYRLDAKGIGLFYTNRALRLYPTFLAITLAIWAQFLITWIVLGTVPGNGWVASYGEMSWITRLTLVGSNWLMIGTDIFSNMYFSAETGAKFMFTTDPPSATLDGMNFMHQFRTIGPAWSLGTEIWFYLLVPFLVRLRQSWLIAIFAASLVCRLWIVHCLDRYPYFFFPAQLIFFIGGIWSYQIYRRRVISIGLHSWQRWLICINWALVITYPFLPVSVPSWALYILFGLSLPIIFRATRDSKWDRRIGDLSYPVYLLHLWVLTLVERFFGVNGALTAILSVALAIVIVIVIEHPIERFRRRRLAAAASFTPFKA